MAEYLKRDVQLVVAQLDTAIKSMSDLNKIGPDRSLSVAITDAQTSRLWLKELADRTPEMN